MAAGTNGGLEGVRLECCGRQPHATVEMAEHQSCGRCKRTEWLLAERIGDCGPGCAEGRAARYGCGSKQQRGPSSFPPLDAFSAAPADIANCADHHFTPPPIDRVIRSRTARARQRGPSQRCISPRRLHALSCTARAAGQHVESAVPDSCRLQPSRRLVPGGDRPAPRPAPADSLGPPVISPSSGQLHPTLRPLTETLIAAEMPATPSVDLICFAPPLELVNHHAVSPQFLLPACD